MWKGETDESSPASTVSEKSDWSITSQKIIDLQILRKIIKIADCGHKVGNIDTNSESHHSCSFQNL